MFQLITVFNYYSHNNNYTYTERHKYMLEKYYDAYHLFGKMYKLIQIRTAMIYNFIYMQFLHNDNRSKDIIFPQETLLYSFNRRTWSINLEESLIIAAAYSLKLTWAQN